MVRPFRAPTPSIAHINVTELPEYIPPAIEPQPLACSSDLANDSILKYIYLNEPSDFHSRISCDSIFHLAMVD